MSEDGRIEALEQRLAAAEMLVASLMGQLSRVTQPRGAAFLALEGDDDDGGWTEQTVVAGEIAEFTDGRSDTEDLIDAGDNVLVLEYDDFDGGSRVKRYVKVAAPASDYYRVRWNESTHALEQTTDREESEWTSIVTFTPCPTPTPTPSPSP